jgi:cytochrome c556
MKPKAKDVRRQQWMDAMQRAVAELSPVHVGRINWDAAIFHFNQGRTPQDAAARIVATEAPVERR